MLGVGPTTLMLDKLADEHSPWTRCGVVAIALRRKKAEWLGRFERGQARHAERVGPDGSEAERTKCLSETVGLRSSEYLAWMQLHCEA